MPLQHGQQPGRCPLLIPLECQPSHSAHTMQCIIISTACSVARLHVYARLCLYAQSWSMHSGEAGGRIHDCSTQHMINASTHISMVVSVLVMLTSSRGTRVGYLFYQQPIARLPFAFLNLTALAGLPHILGPLHVTFQPVT